MAGVLQEAIGVASTPLGRSLGARGRPSRQDSTLRYADVADVRDVTVARLLSEQVGDDWMLYLARS